MTDQEGWVAEDDVSQLAAGHLRDTCGLTLALMLPPPSSIKEDYKAFAEKLRSIEPDSAYIYPFENLHCTVATFISFREGHLRNSSPERRRELISKIRTALHDTIKASKNKWPNGPIEVSFSRPCLSRAAGFFMLDDPQGNIERIRNFFVIPAVASIDCLELTEALIVPKIIHSTFLRFKSVPKHPEQFVKCFDELAASWTPLRISLSHIDLVAEVHPFMHIKRGEDTILEEYSFS